jgi:lipopolysaccharide export system permease protein
MLKKLDKMVLKAFLPPFCLTLVVVVFILLTQFMLKYFDDFVGKNLSAGTYAELLFFFSINSIPLALPISIMISSIMTYGSFSEHNELTAIKSAGISLIRVIQPVFLLVCIMTVGAFYFNNYVVPWANLRGYSLLYDITTKKAAFNIKEGTFYYGLPGFAIKVNHKDPEGAGLREILIYNHQQEKGNNSITLADSGRMSTIWNDRYLVLELYRGANYTEVDPKAPGMEKEYTKNEFSYSKLVFNLSSFEMSRTDMQLFANNKIMRNISELRLDIDSIGRESERIRTSLNSAYLSYFNYFGKRNDGLAMPANDLKTLEQRFVKIRSEKAGNITENLLNQIQSLLNFTLSSTDRYRNSLRDTDVFSVEIYRKYTQSVACLVMFLIGAPLGALIRKGGLGIPVLISILFFILYYMFSITGEKWSKENVVDVTAGMWYTNVLLSLVGIFFLRKAWKDSPLFEGSFPDIRNWFVFFTFLKKKAQKA